MIAKVQSAAAIGLETLPITVEVDLSNGLPGLKIVGLPDKSIDESRERVRAAVRASGGVLPPQRITVNLAPADVRKEGPIFDLPIAVGIMAAAEQLPPPSEHQLFLGELSLSGELKSIRGVLAALSGSKAGTTVFLPPPNAAEAALVDGLTIIPAKNLTELSDHLKGERRLPPYRGSPVSYRLAPPELDFADVRGQQQAKRALEIAAAGGHNALLTGPPGTGKTLLARAMPGILPNLSRAEALEVTKIYSIAGLLDTAGLIDQRPFRSPHHSISLAGLIGGGSWPRPGELTLAHRGVLYLDEIPQFPSHLLEALRGPLEDRLVRISRVQQSVRFPANCMLVASQNPCPCGFAGDPAVHCSCNPAVRERYGRRLSGPIRDRFDLTAEVPRLSYAAIGAADGEVSEQVRQRVTAARQRQTERFGSERSNASLGPAELEAYCGLPPPTEALLREAVDRWHLSVRGCHRVLKVARTIADLAGVDRITEAALAEALQYRPQPVVVTA